MPSTHEFKVAMTCQGCSGAVERVLNRHKGSGIDSFSINLNDQRVSVTGTMSADEILQIIKKTGKETELLSSS